ncbi:uncharacterized protein LOC120828207 isoform X1 [Gasterosteus aculeatus]
MPPKPPRRKYEVTGSDDIAQSASKDPDEPEAAVTVGSRSEDKVKPVPHPRSGFKQKSNCNNNNNNNNNNSVDCADTRSNASSVVTSQLSKHEAPRPVGSPPCPPIIQPRIPAMDGTNLSLTSIPQPANPEVNTKRTKSPPARPPPPSFPESTRSTMRVGPEVTYRTETKPAVPPRPSFVPGTSHPQRRLPRPALSPPPLPPPERTSDPLYYEIDLPPYLDVLPEDVDTMQPPERPTGCYPIGQYCPHQQTADNAKDINGLLTWLKRVSKSDSLASSVYGLSTEEEIRLFSKRAADVRQAVRLYNLLMIERKENLHRHVRDFISISDSLDKSKKESKTMNAAGGTTGAVGGVTAVLGIAFAPMTMGASLIATAIGAGMVASAGGMGVYTAKAKKKIVNRMTVEKLVDDYKANVVDLEHCLGFILDGMIELQRHDFARLQRAGARQDSLNMAHLSKSVLRNNINMARGTSVSQTQGMSSERLLLAFVKEIDAYFTGKEGEELRMSSKSQFSGRVRLLAENLHGELLHLNRMWRRFC